MATEENGLTGAPLYCYKIRIMMISGVPVYNDQEEVELAVIVSNDITEEVEREKKDKIMQKRMEQSQRLESLGVLAGGIANDLDNLLMAILGNADIALLKILQDKQVDMHLKNIKTASLRATDLCTQLLAYSGQGKVEEKEFSLSRLVSEMVQLLKASISKNCVLNLQLEEQLPFIVGDPSQMQQVVMNFVINASESIGDHDGIINISTGRINCSQEEFKDDYVVKPMNSGPHIILEVSDNGCGMPQDTLGRIFEPFFTTKFTGRGLGLSAVLGIIRSHGGGLCVSSEPGLGTSFKVVFPATCNDVAEEPDEVERTDNANQRFLGKVLLVDDEEMVLDVCASQLELLGLEVLTARDGQEGVKIFREKKAEIDLVILDLTMPRMDGKKHSKSFVSWNLK